MVIKLNIDASLVAPSGMGLGYAVRNSMGQVLVALAKFVESLCEVVDAEAMALLSGLKIVGDMGFQNIRVESDSQILVKAIHENSVLQSQIRVILQEIKEWMICIHILGFTFITRSCNEVAHRLARWVSPMLRVGCGPLTCLIG